MTMKLPPRLCGCAAHPDVHPWDKATCPHTRDSARRKRLRAEGPRLKRRRKPS